MWLKQMAFDTAMSSTLNSLGFIALTFEKGRREGDPEDPGVPGFYHHHLIWGQRMYRSSQTGVGFPEGCRCWCLFVCLWKASKPLVCLCSEYESNNTHYSSWKCCSFLFMMENETRGWKVSSLLPHFNMENNIFQGLRMSAAMFAMPAEFVAFRDPALSKYVHSGAKYSSWHE